MRDAKVATERLFEFRDARSEGDEVERRPGNVELVGRVTLDGFKADTSKTNFVLIFIGYLFG